MRTIKHSSAFKRDVKREKKGRYREVFDTELLEIIDQLANDIPLDEKYQDHELQRNLRGYRECHVRGDFLLLYQKIDGELKILRLERLGSHRQVLGIE
ncbi:MAG: type II toxin-antitoxin system YafQ family toxin [Pyramidobacter sp.]|nr:type II toxin-antitoxin system YafQ family toxin [Pyramidobacter sp.]